MLFLLISVVFSAREVGELLFTDLVGGCNIPHSSHDPGGSVGRGPSHQVSFFSFFFLPSFLFLFSVYIFVF
jgi:hypothetical protein